MTSPARPLKGCRSPGLAGAVTVPGDKSISHRALILGGMALGETRITGLLEAEDVLNTAEAVRAFGAQVVRQGPGAWKVSGTGVGGWRRPEDVLDFGNSGTGSRLVMGAMATTPVTAVFTGDASLRKRPMGRVLEPLKLFGAEVDSRPGGLMPVTLKGAVQAMPADYLVPMASAQVKSAMLLAALNAPGRSRISQQTLTRDHTEKMLAAFGADITVEPLEDGGEAITITGEAELKAISVAVPRDPSSAAFPIVAALIVPGSDILLHDVLLNPRRTGLIETLREMGADLTIVNVRDSGGEQIGDIKVRASALKGVEVPPARVPDMIDEFPVLAVAASFAEGPTIMRGLEELRVKESDRLAAIIAGLKANGVPVEELEDGMVVQGLSGTVPGGGTVTTHLDHRIAMSFLVMGLASHAGVTVDDAAMIATSFPEFERLMGGLGAVFAVGEIDAGT
jgi:3-phosphoshikimate 1-carboxyvinyltransferase